MDPIILKKKKVINQFHPSVFIRDSNNYLKVKKFHSPKFYINWTAYWERKLEFLTFYISFCRHLSYSWRRQQGDWTPLCIPFQPRFCWQKIFSCKIKILPKCKNSFLWSTISFKINYLLSGQCSRRYITTSAVIEKNETKKSQKFEKPRNTSRILLFQSSSESLLTG